MTYDCLLERETRGVAWGSGGGGGGIPWGGGGACDAATRHHIYVCVYIYIYVYISSIRYTNMTTSTYPRYSHRGFGQLAAPKAHQPTTKDFTEVPQSGSPFNVTNMVDLPDVQGTLNPKPLNPKPYLNLPKPTFL